VADEANVVPGSHVHLDAPQSRMTATEAAMAAIDSRQERDPDITYREVELAKVAFDIIRLQAKGGAVSTGLVRMATERLIASMRMEEKP
jgi:hypothetical protein